MSKKLWCKRAVLGLLTLCLIFSGAWAMALAADDDVVQVSAISVEWDGNGGAQDLVLLTLEGAAFPELNKISNSHWDYFAPCIFVNGTAVTGQIAWAQEGMYQNAKQFCFFLNQGVLKQDGTDVIEVQAGCRIPLGDGADYYAVSETASFVAPANAQNTGTEAFVPGAGVAVSGLSVVWDGNGGGNDLVTLTLEGAAFPNFNFNSLTHMGDIVPYIFVNGEVIPGVAWAIEGIDSNPKQYQFFLSQGVLRQDGTDVIEVRAGCRIPCNDGASSYLVTETVSFASSGATSGHEDFVKQFVWTAEQYDADPSVFAETAAQTGVLGGFDSQRVVISDIGTSHPTWGIEGWAANTVGNLTEGQFAVFSLIEPLDVSVFKSLTVGYMYNAADLLYVYPLNVTELSYENAVQSFRPSGSGINEVTLSAEALAEDGMLNGFIIQNADGGGAQFFLDSVTPSAEAFAPGPVEEIPEFAWTAEQKYDADASVLKAAPAGNLGSFATGGLNFGSGHADWGLTGDGFANSPAALGEGSYLVFEFSTPMIAAEIGSVSIEVMYNAEALFYVYPLNVTELGFDTAVQSFRTPGSGLNDFVLSAAALAENGAVHGFIVQMMEGEGAQFFLDSFTPSAGQTDPGPVEPASFKWELDKKTDINESTLKPAPAGSLGEYATRGVFLGSGHDDWGLSGGYANSYDDKTAAGEYLVFEFAVPVDAAAAGRLTVEIMYNAEALFYVYPLNVTELGFDTAAQSFRTPGGGVNAFTLSSAALAENGEVKGFIVQLVDGGSASFFLDSVTLSAEPYTPDPVEEVVTFEWEIGKKYDAGSEVFAPTAAASLGTYSSLPVVVRNVDMWGITKNAAFCETNLAQYQFLRFEFAEPLENTEVRSFVIEAMHLAAACFYVYPLNVTELGFDTAVQSFRTPGSGVNEYALSAERLFIDGVCEGFYLQLMTETGVQFFLDSITLSAEAVAAEVEDLTEPEYETAPVSVAEVSYTYRYEGGNVDLLLITFDRNIFNHDLDSSLWNERIGVDDFAACLLINGVSVADSGIGQYALRDMWTRHDRLGIFLTSGVSGSANNDAFDVITFAKGFAIRGSTGDYTLYTTEEDAVFYTNRALDAGGQVTCSAERDPLVDQSLTPLSVTFGLSGGTGTLEITFDKTVRTEVGDFKADILGHILADGVRLSDWGSEVSVAFENMTIRLTFGTENAAPEITVEAGLAVQTNPDEPLTRKSVGRTLTFVRAFEGEDRYFAQGGELFVYWAGRPVLQAAAEEGGTDYLSFDVRLSVQNAPAGFASEALRFVSLDGTSLLDILAGDEGASVSLSGFVMTVRIPAALIGEGTVLSFREGFVTPAGGRLQSDETFTFDGVFGEFNGEVHREEIEDILTPTDVNTIIRATDGVAPGTNQLFIEFTTPCSVKYLPFTQADPATIFNSYGSVGVPMTARYTWELTRYGIRESLWDYLLLDGKTLREWAAEDGGAEASRYIDIYYQGTNFGIYYLQIVINRQSSAVMDWDEAHTLTFKEGFITPAFGVFTEDVRYAWDPEAAVWTVDTAGQETVDPDDQLKEEQPPEEGCGAAAGQGSGLILPALLLTAAAGAAVRRFQNVKKVSRKEDQ